jgi:DNA polymerase epsilon subunit 1
MVEAFKADVIMPNKHHPPHTKFYKGKFIESETVNSLSSSFIFNIIFDTALLCMRQYVGGHVESLEAGVFRSNIPVDFDLDGLALDEV